MYVCNSVESVNDGLFHTVELLIQNRSLSLVVDNGAPKSLGKLARQPSVDHNTQLYIGGMCTHTDTRTYMNIHVCRHVLNIHTFCLTFAWPSLPFCGCDHMFAMHSYIQIFFLNFPSIKQQDTPLRTVFSSLFLTLTLSLFSFFFFHIFLSYSAFPRCTIPGGGLRSTSRPRTFSTSF